MRRARLQKAGWALAALWLLATGVLVQARWRQPNSEYQARRAALRATVDGPVVLFGYTGRETSGTLDRFFQEENFYYLTGYDYPGAALLLVPDAAGNAPYTGPHEILYLPPRDPVRERWEWPVPGPFDADIRERTGFEAVRPLAELQADLRRVTALYRKLYTLLPPAQEAGYPHRQVWFHWLQQVVPGAEFDDIGRRLGAMRQIKSASEIEWIRRAVELSVDAQLAAMRMMRPGLYEYQIAARMEEVHKAGGCEREAYAPIVGAGFNATILHYTALDARIEPGDLVVMDVACEYGGYAADLTRTVPADGHFTPRQREIYEAVLGAQKAVVAALKPGMSFAPDGANSLTRIARQYLDTHGHDRQGRPLGRYFIHGLGHHIGLNVHDAGDPSRPLEPGMVVTIEPGVYIPEEKIGVRIEDDYLITPTGAICLSERLPREVEAIEQLMQSARTGPH